MSQLIELIRHSVIGADREITTPFGQKPLIYADYTASGRALGFIEDFIRDRVLPWYANTHTETSFTGAQTTALREQAREEIRKAVKGTKEDQIIFCGSGATAAINKIIDILGLRLPHDLASRYSLLSAIPAQERPVVFIGPYEHHSNELPWRESIADVEAIPLDDEGPNKPLALEAALHKYRDRALKIGSFSAASNVTGIKSDVKAVTRLLKRQGALAFWDYAAAAPYVDIDMNGSADEGEPAILDAAFISPHKFIGGPGTPGVLVAKRSILKNTIPAVVGGGTVKYVTPEDHRYLEDHERREEGGTPGIVESIRAGLVFKLQQDVGTAVIEKVEQQYAERAMEFFGNCPNLEILGNTQAPRLSIISMRFKHGEKDLHYGFVVSLLNDLFGIQVRGGCSCAGPYGHSLLGMNMAYSRAIEAEIERGAIVLRPGWVRLNFNYFIDEAEFSYLLQAIAIVAEYGWRMLPWYHFDEGAGVWRYAGSSGQLVSSLSGVSFLEMVGEAKNDAGLSVPLEGVLDDARREILSHKPAESASSLVLSESAERLRWFAVPRAAA